MSIKINEPIRIQDEKEQDLYDMYVLEIIESNGNKREMKLFSECDTIDIKKDKKEILKFFFYDRLFAKGGLIEEQRRQDYIYLGKLVRRPDGKYTADRMMKRNDGRISQEYFDELVPILMQSVELEMEEKSEKRNFVCSDIHGMYGSYLEVLKQLRDEDHLWILGDAIDRGKYGIKILQDIMKRDNITYLLGNHDYMLIETIDIMRQYNLTEDDVRKIISSVKNINPIRFSDLHIQELQRIQDEKGMDDYDTEFIPIWVTFNHGSDTLLDYLKLPHMQQEEIYNFLANSKVFCSTKIGKDDIVFTHAIPLKINGTPDKKDLYTSYTYNQLLNAGFTKGQIITYLEERDDNSRYMEWKNYGFTTICGHDPKHGTIDDRRDSGYIRIDANCGNKGKLALYCIEDNTTMYIPSKEEKDLELEAR